MDNPIKKFQKSLNRHVKSIDNALQRVKRKLERYLEIREFLFVLGNLLSMNLLIDIDIIKYMLHFYEDIIEAIIGVDK